jgi:glycosyltransferase involved in cell wall biosynthesis
MARPLIHRGSVGTAPVVGRPSRPRGESGTVPRVATGVLWVTGEVPDREGGGGNQRQAHLLLGLARHVPVDLLVAGPVRDEAVLAVVRRVTDVGTPSAPPPVGRLRRRAAAAWSAWVRRATLDAVHETAVRERLAARLPELVRDVDTVIVHHQGLGPLLLGPRHGHARWVASLFHASAARTEQAAAVEPRRSQRVLLQRDAANAVRLERELVAAADALVVTSEEDAARLGRPGTPTHVVPNGVDLESLRPGPLPADPVVLLAGSLDYAPNVDGTTWFVDAVWPSIRAREPAAQLLVVGRNPPDAIRALGGRDGIEVHADVPEIAPWYARARVSVVPLRIGTGSRIKALQSFAAGCPVVGTTIGLEGLEGGPSEMRTADDPERFAAEVVELLHDDGAAEGQRVAARRVVEAHSWARSADLLADALAVAGADRRPC